jgi:NADH-quinone oxidoreductase subunit L
MAVVAAVTMLGAALAALAQDDIKRVLAWSTVSQLAYMVGALAVGSYEAAGFHLLTHAAFKALLFLAAGAVIHAVHTNYMREMGGLRRGMPVTFATMTVGLAALAGIPPFSGFFSKEAILGAAEEAAHGKGPVASWAGWLVLVVGLLTVAVTAAYVTRLWVMTFLHEPRGTVTPHEAPPAMRWPLVVLAVPALVLGVAGLRSSWMPLWLDNRGVLDSPAIDTGQDPFSRDPFHLGVATILGSLALVGAGAALAWFLWRRDPGADPARALGRARPAFARGFFLDDVYDAVLVRPDAVARPRGVGR